MSDVDNTPLSWHFHPPHGTVFTAEVILSANQSYEPNGVKLAFTRAQAETVLAWIEQTLTACRDYVKALPPTAQKSRRELEEAVRKQKEALSDKPVPEEQRHVTITPVQAPAGPVESTSFTTALNELPVLPLGATPDQIEAHNQAVVAAVMASQVKKAEPESEEAP